MKQTLSVVTLSLGILGMLALPASAELPGEAQRPFSFLENGYPKTSSPSRGDTKKQPLVDPGQALSPFFAAIEETHGLQLLPRLSFQQTLAQQTAEAEQTDVLATEQLGEVVSLESPQEAGALVVQADGSVVLAAISEPEPELPLPNLLSQETFNMFLLPLSESMTLPELAPKLMDPNESATQTPDQQPTATNPRPESPADASSADPLKQLIHSLEAPAH
jgi:hypothetical protein